MRTATPNRINPGSLDIVVYPITSVGIKAVSLLTAGVNRPTHYVERGEREAVELHLSRPSREISPMAGLMAIHNDDPGRSRIVCRGRLRRDSETFSVRRHVRWQSTQ